MHHQCGHSLRGSGESAAQQLQISHPRGVHHVAVSTPSSQSHGPEMTARSLAREGVCLGSCRAGGGGWETSAALVWGPLGSKILNPKPFQHCFSISSHGQGLGEHSSGVRGLNLPLTETARALAVRQAAGTWRRIRNSSSNRAHAQQPHPRISWSLEGTQTRGVVSRDEQLPGRERPLSTLDYGLPGVQRLAQSPEAPNWGSSQELAEWCGARRGPHPMGRCQR